MSTTYPLPAEVLMFSDNEVSPAKSYCSGKRKRIARIRSVARTISSRRRINGRAIELVNGHESFLALSSRGALSILDSSFKFAWASYSVSESHGRPCAWNRKHSAGFYVSSAVIGVCAGLMCASVRMRRKSGSHSRSVKDVVSLPRRSVVFRRGQGSKEAPGPSVPGRVRFAQPPDFDLESSGSDENEGSLPRRECRADFPEVSLQLLDPSKWRLAAYDCFFREENIIILEARSILYAVRYAGE